MKKKSLFLFIGLSLILLASFFVINYEKENQNENEKLQHKKTLEKNGNKIIVKNGKPLFPLTPEDSLLNIKNWRDK